MDLGRLLKPASKGMDGKTMQNVYRDGRFDPDIWDIVDDDSPLPEAGFAVISKDRFLSERDNVQDQDGSIGLVLRAGDSLDGLEEDLESFRLIALDFPKFSDGRAYSLARLLRENHGYDGELRAIGDVLIDQIPLMRRCGFDSFSVSHQPSREALERGDLPDVPFYTQPIAEHGEVPTGGRPWLRVPQA